jgi:hypothetical protein
MVKTMQGVTKQAAALAAKHPLEKTLKDIQTFMDSVSEGKDSTNKISDAADSATIDPREREAIEAAADMFTDSVDAPLAHSEFEAERDLRALHDALREL